MIKIPKKKCHFEIGYFDPADPEGERWKTWKSKSKKKLKVVQDDLKVAWDADAREFPIKKVCNGKKH